MSIKRPTRDDVARHAGVSGWTVSKVLNGSESAVISEHTRSRVIAAANRIGYRSNHAARSLATGRSHLVSVYANMRSPFYVKCVNYLNRLLTQEGYQMLVVNATAMESAAVRPLDLADGIIAIECSYEIDSFLKTHPAFAPPFVSVGAYFVESVDHVSVDLYGSEREALDQLISIGCKRIAFALGDGRSDAPDQRRSAYLDGMKEAGLKTEMIQVPKDLRSEARGAVKEYIRQNGCPDGILCHNDDKALGIYRGLRELGLNVPNDVALVGCDGIDELEYLDCPISTIVQPVESICETAWAFLQNRIADPEIPRQEKALKSRFVMRESSNRAHAEP